MLVMKRYCDICDREVESSEKFRRNTTIAYHVGDTCPDCYDRLRAIGETANAIVKSMRVTSSLVYPLCAKRWCSYFLSGPMTGRPDWNRAAFAEVETALRDHYCLTYGDSRRNDIDVYNPAEDAPDTPEAPEPHTYYMRVTLHRLTPYYYDTRNPMIDAVILLPGWERSMGAVTEAIVASECGIDLVLWEGLPGEGDE